ncbi:hypothetical protein ABZ543_21435 [Streptomyces roseifaciens]
MPPTCTVTPWSSASKPVSSTPRRTSTPSSAARAPSRRSTTRARLLAGERAADAAPGHRALIGTTFDALEAALRAPDGPARGPGTP